MTDEILSELEAKSAERRAKSGEITSLYNDISTMQAFNMRPRDWHKLSRFDRLLLNYQRVMQQYYEGKAWEEQKKKMEREEQNRKFMNSLPKVGRR